MFKSILATTAVVALASVSAHAGPAEPCKTILELATTTPSLSKLVEYVSQANLVGVLQGPGPITVFAPTNEAFNMLTTQDVAHLFSSPVILRSFINGHLVVGKEITAKRITSSYNYNYLEKADGIPVANGQVDVYNYSYNGDGTGFSLQLGESHTYSSSIATNIVACNGIVHLMDSVLSGYGRKTAKK